MLIDLVVNHTSNEHPWFQEARAIPNPNIATGMCGQRGSQGMPLRESPFLVFKNPPGPMIRWPSSITSIASTSFQPDLNTANPEVQAEILKIMGFWLQLGVSGFRMDAVPFVIAKKGARHFEATTEQYEMLQGICQFLNWREGEAIILGEANVLPDTDMEYFGESGERLQMMFNFEVNQHLFLAMATAILGRQIEAMSATRQPPCDTPNGKISSQPR